jgi:hypothetical protein
VKVPLWFLEINKPNARHQREPELSAIRWMALLANVLPLSCGFEIIFRFHVAQGFTDSKTERRDKCECNNHDYPYDQQGFTPEIEKYTVYDRHDNTAWNEEQWNTNEKVTEGVSR